MKRPMSNGVLALIAIILLLANMIMALAFYHRVVRTLDERGASERDTIVMYEYKTDTIICGQ